MLNKLPKRLPPDAKSGLHEMMKAATKANADETKTSFENLYQDKYSKATECLEKSWPELTNHFHYPIANWQHIRTTNPIESSFATVKLRTKVTKGAGSKASAATMTFKLLPECQKKWRKLKSHEEIINLLKGVEYKDGIMMRQQQHQEAATSRPDRPTTFSNISKRNYLTYLCKK